MAVSGHQYSLHYLFISTYLYHAEKCRKRILCHLRTQMFVQNFEKLGKCFFLKCNFPCVFLFILSVLAVA